MIPNHTTERGNITGAAMGGLPLGSGGWRAADRRLPLALAAPLRAAV